VAYTEQLDNVGLVMGSLLVKDTSSAKRCSFGVPILRTAHYSSHVCPTGRAARLQKAQSGRQGHSEGLFGMSTWAVTMASSMVSATHTV
jgi:hypothetical protein